MRFPALPYCEECGEVRKLHRLFSLPRFLSSDVETSTPEPTLLKVTADTLEEAIMKVLTPARVLSIARFLSYTGAVSSTAEAKSFDNTRTQALYEGALPSGVTLTAVRVFNTTFCFVAEKEVKESREQILFTIIPRPKGFVSPSLPWMDDKGILKQELIKADLPCAEGGIATTLEEALTLFRSIGRPVIAKPHTGSRGRHTTLDIRTEAELERGFKIAQQLAEQVVIEAYLKGTVHRVTLVGGEPVAVARREYPNVIGDGTHTVSELIEIENRAPYRNGTHFKKLDPRHRTEASLRKQELTLDSIPEAGRMVILNDKNSRLHGTLTEDVTETVHPKNTELFRRLGSVLADPIVGVDFMIDDMSRSWEEQPDAGVIECNSMPFIDVHHRVVSGKQINVAEHLWREVFHPRYRK